MRRHTCENAVHRDWWSECADHEHPCPWCENDRLNKLVDSQRVLIANRGQLIPRPCPGASAHGIECELNAGHAGTHRRRGDGVEWTWGP